MINKDEIIYFYNSVNVIIHMSSFLMFQSKSTKLPGVTFS